MLIEERDEIEEEWERWEEFDIIDLGEEVVEIELVRDDLWGRWFMGDEVIVGGYWFKVWVIDVEEVWVMVKFIDEFFLRIWEVVFIVGVLNLWVWGVMCGVGNRFNVGVKWLGMYVEGGFGFIMIGVKCGLRIVFRLF